MIRYYIKSFNNSLNWGLDCQSLVTKSEKHLPNETSKPMQIWSVVIRDKGVWSMFFLSSLPAVLTFSWLQSSYRVNRLLRHHPPFLCLLWTLTPYYSGLLNGTLRQNSFKNLQWEYISISFLQRLSPFSSKCLSRCFLLESGVREGPLWLTSYRAAKTASGRSSGEEWSNMSCRRLPKWQEKWGLSDLPPAAPFHIFLTCILSVFSLH